MKLKRLISLLKETVKEWNEDKASRLAAALAYYTVFSLAPLLILVIAIAGAILGEQAAEGQLVGQIRGLVGQDAAELISTAIRGANRPGESSGLFPSLVSIAILLFGATGVFVQLQESLNTIWEVAPKPGRQVKGFLQQRFLSFGMILVIAFLLLISLVISAVLAALNSYMSSLLPGVDFLWIVLNWVISLGVITFLFALIFKFLPDVEITWRDVAIGAFITAILFSIGKTLIGIYLGNSSFSSTYGAAGSLVVILAWVFYSAQILFFGAEFTQVYARRYGSRIVPSEHAVPVTEEGRAQQGLPRQEDLEETAEQMDRRSDRRMSRSQRSSSSRRGRSRRH
ncbi:YihY/virulence factor BrkB family protein [Microcoleus sp. FACHB-1515]|uniref:YihY/virulence factor BrkB family protein n=1 Tax=Cyanophyceae TaxID=3028117 RepID=UPI0016843FDE|nr:YihY/virulence factor BrkB family protein [Microcoleus sp. FACHB-1515]MBD2088632.1 YihY/virulence factor BrkB family protein [Microcoleus sp. FACHB-1515]